MTEPRQYPTLPDLVDLGLDKNVDIACSVKRAGQWRETSVASFREQIGAFAAGLFDLGIRKGDRVALHAENSTEWLVIDQAILRLGAVSVPIYTTQPGDQIKYIVDNAGARAYIVSTEALFAGAPSDLKDVASLQWTIGILGSFAEDMLTYGDVLERGRNRLSDDADLVAKQQQAIRGEDIATLAYTSGTTGVPKGVMLTHSGMASNVLAIDERLPFEPPGRMLSYLPLSHSLERAATLAYLHLGCPIYFVEDFLEIAEDIKTVRPLHMSSVPRLLEKIHVALGKRAAGESGLKGVLMRWALARANRYDVTKPARGLRHALADRLVYKKIRDAVFGGELEAFTCGGAALSASVQAFFNAIGIFCGQGYGLTETSPVITMYTKGELRPGSVGTPVTDVEVRIADDGEILARGPNIMKGYYRMPDKTAEVMSEGRWFHTGDIGHLDDGHLYITDRKKQLFKLSTGKYIAPTPIEVALCDSPFIEQAVVIGSDRKFCAALIIPDAQAVSQHVGVASGPEVNNLVAQAVERANQGLPHWEQVKKFCLLEQPFSIETGELTPTMKVKRRVVREKYQEQIGSLYKD